MQPETVTVTEDELAELEAKADKLPSPEEREGLLAGFMAVPSRVVPPAPPARRTLSVEQVAAKRVRRKKGAASRAARKRNRSKR